MTVTSILRRRPRLAGAGRVTARCGPAWLPAARIRDVDVTDATDSGSPEELFESVERWRAASHRIPPLRPPEDPETADLVRRLRRLRQHGSGDEHASTQTEMSLLQDAITHRLRTARGSRRETDDSSATAAEAVRTAVARGSTLVTFHEVRGTVVRLVLTGSGIRQSVLGTTEEVAAVASRATSDVRAATVARPSMLPSSRRPESPRCADVDATLLTGLDPDGTVVIAPTWAWPTALATLRPCVTTPWSRLRP